MIHQTYEVKGSEIPFKLFSPEERNVFKEAYTRSQKYIEFLQSPKIATDEVLIALKTAEESDIFSSSKNTTDEEKKNMPQRESAKTYELRALIRDGITGQNSEEILIIGVISSSTKYDNWWASAEEKWYGIVRFGDSLQSFSELKKMAKERYTGARKLQLTKSIRMYQRELQDLDIDCIEKFGY